MLPTRTGPVSPPAANARPRRHALGWIAACALSGVVGYGLGAAGRPEPVLAARVVPADEGRCPTTSWTVPAVAPEPPAPAASEPAAGVDLALDPPPPMENTQAFVAWKRRHLAAGAPQLPAAPVHPGVKASEELREAAARERGALVSSCWNAQAPADLEGGTEVKVLASVDGAGQVGGWQVFEVPETRRPELVECVRTILSRAVTSVSAPERPVPASTTIRFP